MDWYNRAVNLAAHRNDFDQLVRETTKGLRTAFAQGQEVRTRERMLGVGDGGEAERLDFLQVGHVLTEANVKDIDNMITDHNSELEATVDLYNDARIQVLREIGGEPLVQAAREADLTQANLSIATALLHYRQQRDEAKAKLAPTYLAEVLLQLQSGLAAEEQKLRQGTPFQENLAFWTSKHGKEVVWANFRYSTFAALTVCLVNNLDDIIKHLQSDVTAFAEAATKPLLVATGEPLEPDDGYRERLRVQTTDGNVLESLMVAHGEQLDAIGVLYDVIRGGMRRA